MAKTFVLVHGAYHGGWCWRDLARMLRAGGHEVHTPTLTGLGERSHLIGCRPTLATFAEDVCQVIRFEDLQDVILVGHSFGGSVISGVADRMPERLAHLVYLDAMLLEDGQSTWDSAPLELVEKYRAQADETSGGLSVPPPDPTYFGITDPDMQALVARKTTPHPFATYTEPLRLSHPLGNGVPMAYITCTAPLLASTARARDLARSLPHCRQMEIATGHNAMMTAPEELMRMLLTL